MKTLNEKEKEIIRLIQKKEITDILSFIKHYKLGNEVCFNKSDITEKFNNIFGEKEYIIKHNQDKSIFLSRYCVIEDIDKDTSKCRPFLTFEKSSEQEFYGNEHITYTFNLFEPTYICEDMNEILQFIAVWQYLENERLVIELPKSCKKEDFALFLSKENIEPQEIIIDENNLTLTSMKVYACYLMDWQLKFNKTNFELCYPYLCKKIYPTLALNTFIENNFQTKSDISESRNFKIALAGILIAFFTSLASIIISIIGMSDRGYYKELQNINNSIQEIRDELHIDESERNADE